MNSASTLTSKLEAERLVREQFRIIETGDLDLADTNVPPDYVNHRSVHEPLAARSGGPDALKATAGWLRRALRDLHDAVRDHRGIRTNLPRSQASTTALTTGAAVLTTLITTGVLAYAVLAM